MVRRSRVPASTEAPILVPPRRRRNEKSFWSLDKEGVLAAVWRAYEEEGSIGQTVRHYYYKLLSAGAVRLHKDNPKSGENAYKHVGKVIGEARLANLLPWSAVVDPGRRSRNYYAHVSLAEYIRRQTRSYYTADIWRGQPRKFEVWIEKDGIFSFVNQVVQGYRVPVYVAKGYASETVMKDAADRYGNGRGWTLLYVGDFDPSGVDIERDLGETLRVHGSRPQIKRVAMTLEDTAQFPDAALELKKDDKRRNQFIATYGEDQKGYELEAMPASQLQRKLLDALALDLDFGEIERVAGLEEAVRREADAVLSGALDALGERIYRDGLPGVDMATIYRYLDAEQGA